MEVPEQSQAYARVKEALRGGNYEEALGICDLVLDSKIYGTVNITPYLLARSTAFSKAGELDSALRDAKAAIKSKPDDPKCYLRAASALHASGFSQKALSSLSIARGKCSISNESHASLLSRIETLTAQIERNPSSSSSKIIQKSQPKDPLVSLPPEIFCKVLCILDQSSRVSTTGVSQDWRKFAYDSPTLWQEVQLIKSRWNFSKSTFPRILAYSRGTLKSLHLDLPQKFWTHSAVATVGGYKETLEAVFIRLGAPTNVVVLSALEDPIKDPIEIKLAETLRDCPRLKSLSFHSDGTYRGLADPLLLHAKFQKLSSLSLANLVSSRRDLLGGLLCHHFDEMKEFAFIDSTTQLSIPRHLSQTSVSTRLVLKFLIANKRTIEKFDASFRCDLFEEKESASDSEVELPSLKTLRLIPAFTGRVSPPQERFDIESLVLRLRMPALSTLDLGLGLVTPKLSEFLHKLPDQTANIRTLSLWFNDSLRIVRDEEEVLLSMGAALQKWRLLECFSLVDDCAIVKTRPMLKLFHTPSIIDGGTLPCPQLRELHLSSLEDEATGEVIGEAVRLVASRLKASRGNVGGNLHQENRLSNHEEKYSLEPKGGGAFIRGGSNSNIAKEVKSKNANPTATSTSVPKPSSSNPVSDADSSTQRVSQSVTATNAPPVPLAALHLPKVDFQSIDQKALDWLRSKLEVVTFSPPAQSKASSNSRR